MNPKKERIPQTRVPTYFIPTDLHSPGSTEISVTSGTRGTIGEGVKDVVPHKPLRRPNRRKPLDS